MSQQISGVHFEARYMITDDGKAAYMIESLSDKVHGLTEIVCSRRISSDKVNNQFALVPRIKEADRPNRAAAMVDGVHPVKVRDTWNQRAKYQLRYTFEHSLTRWHTAGTFECVFCATLFGKGDNYKLLFDLAQGVNVVVTSEDVTMVALPIVRYLMPEGNNQAILNILFTQAWKAIRASVWIQFKVTLWFGYMDTEQPNDNLKVGDVVKVSTYGTLTKEWGRITNSDFD